DTSTVVPVVLMGPPWEVRGSPGQGWPWVCWGGNTHFVSEQGTPPDLQNYTPAKWVRVSSRASPRRLVHSGQGCGVALANEGAPVERVLERPVAVRLPGQLFQGATRFGVAGGELFDSGVAEPLRPQPAHSHVPGGFLRLAERQVAVQAARQKV